MNKTMMALAAMLMMPGLAVAQAEVPPAPETEVIEVHPRRMGKSQRQGATYDPPKRARGKSESLKRMLAEKGRK